MELNANVATKWGDSGLKAMLRNCRSWQLSTLEMTLVISFCQSLRVVRTKGVVCSKVHPGVSGESSLRDLANSR